MGFKISASSKQDNDRTNVFIGILGLGIVAAIGVFSYSLFSEEKNYNAQTLCPADGAVGHVVLLVDKSDPMSFTQRKNFEVLYEEIVTRVVPKDHLFSVYALAEDFTVTAEPLLERCNPGDGSDTSRLDGNPEQVRKAYREKYIKPLIALREELITEKPGKASPILEMIQLAGITGFSKHAIAGEKRLILVSDMIQNTAHLNMYKGVPKYDAFIESAYGKKSLADLKDVKVEFRMLLNTPKVQGEPLLKFWIQHIQQSGGRWVLHEPIKG